MKLAAALLVVLPAVALSFPSGRDSDYGRLSEPLFYSKESHRQGAECEIFIRQETRQFEQCTELDLGLKVFWSFPGDGNIEMAIQKPTENEYIGFGFTSNGMMTPNSALIAFVKPNGTTFASDYRLTERSSDGVVSGEGGQGLSGVKAQFRQGVLTAVFNRPLAPSDSNLPTLTPGEETAIIWAVGSAPESGTALTQHSMRRAGTIELIGAEEVPETPVPGQTSNPAPPATQTPVATEKPSDPAPSPVPVPTEGPDEPAPPGNCVLTIPSGTMQFDSCTTLEEDVNVFWSFPAGGEAIEVAIQRESPGEYVGFSFSQGPDMVPNSAVIGFPTTDGNSSVFDYRLTERSSAGVLPDQGGQGLTSLESFYEQDTLTILFTRPLAPADAELPSLSPDTEVPIIWAVGAAPESGNLLMQHTSRFSGMLNLAGGQTGAVPTAAPTDAPSELDECSLDFGGELEQYEFCQTLELGIDVFWRFPDEREVIEVAIQRASADEYIGFSFSEEALMVPNSAVIAFPTQDGNSSVFDYRMTARNSDGVVPGEGGQELQSMESEFSQGRIKALFTRPLIIRESGLPELDPAAEVPILWSVGPAPDSGNRLAQHTSRRAGMLDLSGANSVVTGSTTLPAILIAHAILMCVAWLFLVPVGVLFARYAKSWGPWFQVHRAIQGTAVLLGTVAWILGLVEGTRTSTAHLVIGSVVSVFGVLQVLGGIFRPHAPEEGEEVSSTRKIWYLGHSNFGRVGGILAFVNIFLGVTLARTRESAGGSTTGYIVGIAVYIGLLAASIIVLEFLKHRKSST